MESQRVGHDWVTELNWGSILSITPILYLISKLLEEMKRLPESHDFKVNIHPLEFLYMCKSVSSKLPQEFISVHSYLPIGDIPGSLTFHFLWTSSLLPVLSASLWLSSSWEEKPLKAKLCLACCFFPHLVDLRKFVTITLFFFSGHQVVSRCQTICPQICWAQCGMVRVFRSAGFPQLCSHPILSMCPRTSSAWVGILPQVLP